jgi:hypothetical protein
MTKCYYCHKTIHGDYGTIKGENGREKYLHPICLDELRKLKRKALAEERAQKAQQKLSRYNFLDSA